MPTLIHYVSSLKENRRNLRNALTPAEATLWEMLQRSQLHGKKFRRQHRVGPYILDFYCPSEMLAIKLDGAHHFTDAGFEDDLVRTAYLENLYIRVLRFENKEAFEQTEGVLEVIRRNFRSAF
ncbi:endonuclease domain-containing protein [Rufibacter sp. XAAS-G3-1]|uniref:endonuclease domain-containing protein n=1 Tax=Rufibacter sp. XAAS-G3-1 TaxID=2729134 RepID=UPI0015E62E33|nr:endonuclease domain-containing protein [Rufibacter sp. XAAS-G3-1]